MSVRRVQLDTTIANWVAQACSLATKAVTHATNMLEEKSTDYTMEELKEFREEGQRPEQLLEATKVTQFIRGLQ
jgi:hypothetical protein